MTSAWLWNLSFPEDKLWIDKSPFHLQLITVVILWIANRNWRYGSNLNSSSIGSWPSHPTLTRLSPDSHPSLTTPTISAYTYDHPKSQKRKSYHLLIVILSSPNTLAIINLTFSTSIVLFSQKTSSLQNTWSLFQFLLWNSVKKITEKVQSFRNTLWIFIKWVTAQFNNKCPCFLVSDWITTLISK